MPVESCTVAGRPAFRWGDTGKAFTYTEGDREAAGEAKRKAFLQGYAAGETAKMTGDELQAARVLTEHYQVRKDAGGDLIVAWFPYDGMGGDGDELARELASLVPGGLTVQDIHLTLLYLGDPAYHDVDLVQAAVKIWATVSCYSVDCKIGGMGRFVGEGDQDVLVALVDSPTLCHMREGLAMTLRDVGCAGEPPNGHGYLPHMTLAYVSRQTATPAPLTETLPFTIDSVTVAAGERRMRSYLPDVGPEEGAERIALAVAETSRAEQIEEQLLEEDELEYAVTKTTDEKRYTFGPLYAPDRLDAHGEFTDAETLQAAVWDYVRQSSGNGRRINLQHDDSGEATVGEWVEVCAWPYETTIKVATATGEERTLTMPEGTVYMGVIWDERAWDEGIKKGILNGYSLGGRCLRVRTDAEFDHMGDKLAAADPEPTPSELQVAPELGDPRKDEYEEQLTLLRAAAETEERRNREEIEALKAQAAEERGLVTRMIDALKGFADRPDGDVHVHLPATDLTVHTPEVKVAGAAAPDVTVNVEAKPAVGATETIAERGPDGLISRSITRPIEES